MAYLYRNEIPKMILKILQDSQGNTPVSESFFCNFIKKVQLFSSKFCEIFEKVFIRTSPCGRFCSLKLVTFI